MSRCHPPGIREGFSPTERSELRQHQLYEEDVNCRALSPSQVHCSLLHKSRDKFPLKHHLLWVRDSPVLMALRSINFNVVSCKIPTPKYLPVTAVLTHSLHRFVSPLDTIRIQGNTAREPYLPPILVRIISINHHLNDRHKSPIPLHPNIVRPLADGPIILLQLIVTKQQLLGLDQNAHG